MKVSSLYAPKTPTDKDQQIWIPCKDFQILKKKMSKEIFIDQRIKESLAIQWAYLQIFLAAPSESEEHLPWLQTWRLLFLSKVLATKA